MWSVNISQLHLLNLWLLIFFVVVMFLLIVTLFASCGLEFVGVIWVWCGCVLAMPCMGG